MTINMNITDRCITAEGAPVIICGNSDYTMNFTFDSEWSAEDYKTARFVYTHAGKIVHQDALFSGTSVEVPVLTDTTGVFVGVFAGDLKTTTRAWIPCKPSILCDAGDEVIRMQRESDQAHLLLHLALSQQTDAEAAASVAVEAADVSAEAAAKVTQIVAGNEAYTKAESDRRHAPAIQETVEAEHIAADDSAEAPLLGLSLFGKSKQTAVPSPSAPQTILSPGSSGSIHVGVQGFQLFDPKRLASVSAGGAAITNNGDGSLTVTGNAKTTAPISTSYSYSHEEFKKRFRAGKLNLVSTKTRPYFSANVKSMATGDTIEQLSHANPSCEITQEMLDNEDYYFVLHMYCGDGEDVIAGTTKPILYQDGSGEWEPFSEPQSLELALADSLYGVPVKYSYNAVYSDDSGHWCSDEIDLEEGKLIRRCAKFVLDGTEDWTLSTTHANTFTVAVSNLDINHYIVDGGLCSHYPEVFTNAFGVENGIYLGWTARIYVSDLNCADVASFKAFLASEYAAGRPVTIIARVAPAEYTETPLSEVEIAAYKALRSNLPSTTVLNDASAGMMLQYSADPKNWIKKQIAEAIGS